jgi:ubiquinone/menaquinone biosynthesis C-methylase UbiE
MFGDIGSEGGTVASFRRQAWQEWTDPSIIEAWIKWKDKAALHQAELTRFLLDRTGLFVGANVLDLASGTGEPALTLAGKVGDLGRVTATEISDEFINCIQSQAIRRGHANLTVVKAEACNLPFPDESFDVVTSRLGAMYFVPVEQAMSEIRRVLKPGGRVSLLTWGMPEQSSYYKSCVFPFLMRTNVDPPARHEPTLLRFSPPGSLCSTLEAAGFGDVSEDRDILSLSWPGEPSEFWQHLYEVAASLRTIFDSLTGDCFTEAYDEAQTMLSQMFDGEATTMTAEVVVGSGTR